MEHLYRRPAFTPWLIQVSLFLLKALLEEYRKNAYFQESIGDWLSRQGTFLFEKSYLMRK